MSDKGLFDDDIFSGNPTIQRLLAEVEEGGGSAEEIDARYQQRLSDLSSPLGQDLVGRLKTGAAAMLADRRSMRRRFQKRLRRKWGQAFDTLRMLVEAGLEAGSSFNQRYQAAAAEEQDYLFEALRRLHARACLTANEIIWQMEGGFASGAMARWRTLHELSVVAYFLKEHGPELAERYLLHDRIDSHKAAKQYQAYCERLEQTPLGEEEIRQWQETRDELCRRFGRAYSQDWGWAAVALGMDRPTFADIERSIDLDHMRPYFKMACYSNHAGSKGLSFDLGNVLVPPDRPVLLSGPSDAGFFDPGFCTAVSFLQVTVALLTHKSTLMSLTVVNALERLLDEVEDEFAVAEAALEEQSKKLRQQPVDVSSQGPIGWIVASIVSPLRRLVRLAPAVLAFRAETEACDNAKNVQ